MRHATSHFIIAIVLLAMCAMSGCGDTESPSDPTTILPESTEASRAFQRIWKTSLYPNLTEHQNQCIGGLDAAIRSGESIASRQISFRDGATHFNVSVADNGPSWRILHGVVSDLDCDGTGWEVVADPYPGRGNTVVAVLDNEFKLVFAWIGLEG